MIEFKKLSPNITYQIQPYDTNNITSVAKSYISSKIWYNNPGYVASDSFEELNQFRIDLLGFLGNKQLQPNETLFIHDHSFIPSILISQLNQEKRISHKRCVSVNKASTIVCDLDFSTLYFYYYTNNNLNNEKSIYVCFIDPQNPQLIHCSVPEDKMSVKKNFEVFSKHQPNAKYYLFLYNIDVVKLIYEYPDKIIDSRYFAFQLQDSLPEIEDEEWDTLKSMIQSSDKSNQSLAYKIMQSRDIRSRYFDIAKAIKATPCSDLATQSAMSTAMTYIVSQLGIDYDRLRLNGELTVSCMMDIYNRTINKQELKDKSLHEIYNHAAKLLMQVVPDLLDYLNCTISIIPNSNTPVLPDPHPAEQRLTLKIKTTFDSSCKDIMRFLKEHNMQYIFVRHDP